MKMNFVNRFLYSPLGAGGITVLQTIPILRIFDYAKAVEFYVDWLGFSIAWEHHFEENTPVYLEITKGALTLHLSEHHGDGTPGSHVFIWCEKIKEYHEELIGKKYRQNRPGLNKTFYNALSFVVTDPFNNKISFNEKLPATEG